MPRIVSAANTSVDDLDKPDETKQLQTQHIIKGAEVPPGALKTSRYLIQLSALSEIACVQAASPGSAVITGSEPPDKSDCTVR